MAGTSLAPPQRMGQSFKRLSPREADLMAVSKATTVPCPLCGSDRLAPYVMAPSHYGPERYAIARCDECDMIFTNPQFDFYDSIAESRGSSHGRFTPAHMHATVQHARFVLGLLESCGGGGRLLDFGCGAGGFVATALKHGWNAEGYDLNVGGIAEAKRLWKTDRFSSAKDFLTVNAHAFDVVVSLQVFEHLARPLDVGRELLRLVKPGGLVLIDVPNVQQLGERRSKGSTLDPTAHLCHFSLKTLTHLMRTLGCEVVYQSAAPSFYSVYRRLKLGALALPLARLSKRILPGIGTGVCVIGRTPQEGSHRLSARSL